MAFSKFASLYNVKIYFALFLLFCMVIFVQTSFNYVGNIYAYLLFTFMSFFLLFSGFRKNAIFFDAFIGIFLWLGFWFKFSFRVAYMDSLFNEGTGLFDGSGHSYNNALLAASIAFFAIITVSICREKYLFNYPDKSSLIQNTGLFHFYSNNRSYILCFFLLFVIVIALFNYHYVIYQRGTIPLTSLPLGLNGIVKWLLLFGFTSIGALIISYEFLLYKTQKYNVALISLFEVFISSLSMLSRGMIINSVAIFYGVWLFSKSYNVKLTPKYIITCLLIFATLFSISLYLTNYLRVHNLFYLRLTSEQIVGNRIDAEREVDLKENAEKNITKDSQSNSHDVEYVYYIEKNYFDKLPLSKKYHRIIVTTYYKFIGDFSRNIKTIQLLFIDRWVGIEALLAVSSYPDKGWSLWRKAWQETLSYNQKTFFDEEILKHTSPYDTVDFSKHHHISVVGFIAFSFYNGSKMLLFVFIALFSLLAVFIEYSAYKLGKGNLILCSLISCVVAYRFVHFGYAPIQSYKIFGAIYLNLFLVFIFNLLLSKTNKKSLS